MTPVEQNRLLKEFYNRLKDEPLEPHHPYYVPYREETPGDPIASLATQIDWRVAAGINLLSGQRGSGKSTELRRLRVMLEGSGCVVFLSDMRQYMNMTSSVEISDFFLSLMTALADEVQARYASDPRAKGRWERFLDFLQTEVRLGEIGFTRSGVSLKLALRDDPDFRQQLQDHLRGHVARLIKEVHEFAADVVEMVREKDGDRDKKVVFLVDSLEQIRGVGAEADAVYRSVENLFSGHADSLRFPLLNVLYTLPPWLTPLSHGLGTRLGCGIQTLPSIHVFQGRSRHADRQGLETMRRIVEKRFAEWEQVFRPEQLDRMALVTGGDLREFFYLLRFCLVEAGASRAALPVSDDLITSGENEMRRNMLPIAEEDRVWLAKIARSNEPELESVKELPSLSRFFDTKLVLNYRNGDDWYDIHPLIREAVVRDGGG